MDKPLVADSTFGLKTKAVWQEHGRFWCHSGSGRTEVRQTQSGIWETIPGTFEQLQPKRLPEWKRRALARMAV